MRQLITTRRITPLITASVSLLASLLLGACAELGTPAVPIRTIDLTPRRPGNCLVVLLPGRFAEPEGFAKARWADDVSMRGLHADLVAVDAHLGYYRTRTIIERVKK